MFCDIKCVLLSIIIHFLYGDHYKATYMNKSINKVKE